MGLPQNSDLFRVNVGGTQGVAGTGSHHSVTFGEMLEATEEHLQDAFDAKVDESQLGVPNGVATLNASGLIPSTQLPSNPVGGFEVEITTAQENDILQLKSSKWRNSTPEHLTDGGNF